MDIVHLIEIIEVMIQAAAHLVMAQVLIEENSGIIVVQNATEVDRVLIHGEIMVKNVKNVELW